MAIKFEKIQPGMRLWQRKKDRFGRPESFPVFIKSVDPVARTARASWNYNPETTWHERQLVKLYVDMKPKEKKPCTTSEPSPST